MRLCRQASSIIILCDTVANKKSWCVLVINRIGIDDLIIRRLTELTNTLLAYHANTQFARSRLGWYHEIIMGTIHSAALLGDIIALRKHLKQLEKKGSSPDIADESGMQYIAAYEYMNDTFRHVSNSLDGPARSRSLSPRIAR